MDQLSLVAASFTGFLPGLPNSIKFMCVFVSECAVDVCVNGEVRLIISATSQLSDQMGLSCQLRRS